MPWRAIRDLVKGAVVQTVAKILAGLLALFGAGSLVDPQLPASLHGQTVVSKPSGS